MEKKIMRRAVAAFVSAAVMTVGANAASYTVGTKLDYESAVSVGEKVSQVQDPVHGGCLKMTGGNLVYEFDGLKTGKYMLSFDALMSDTGANLFIYTNRWNADEVKWEQMSFMSLREGGKVTTYPNNKWSFPQIGTATFEAGKWQKYDIILEFDADNPSETMWGEVYIDGKYMGDINLTENSITGMSKVHFTFADYTGTGAYCLIDDFCMKEYTETATMSVKRNISGEFEVEFSETMSDLSESDFTLTRTPIEGGQTEKVGLILKSSTLTNAVLVPSDAARGYVYTLSVSDDLKTAFGGEITSKSFSVVMQKAETIDKIWDFEDGKLPDGANAQKVEIVSVENRGKVLKYNNSADINFKTGKTLDKGVYIYSYDFMRTSKTEAPYLLVRAYNASKWNCFETAWDTSKFGEFGTESDPKRGWGVIQLGGQTVTDGTWYRIDNVMDMDNKLAYVYCNGELLGQIDLAKKDLNEFTGAMMSVTGKNAYYDNIRIRDLRDTYGAKLSINGNKLYIDFEETTYGLTDESFSVTRTDGLFDGVHSEVSAELVYTDGARAVLELDDGAVEGAYYSVDFNNVKSFAGSSLTGTASARAIDASAGQSLISKIEFVDTKGETYGVSEVPSSTKEIVISYPNGMQGADFNGSIELTVKDNSAEGFKNVDGFTGEWNDAEKTYTVTFDKLLGANEEYTITMSGATDADGKSYKAETGSFVTGDAVFEISEVGFEKTADGIDVTFDCVNTDKAENCIIVWTGYAADGSMSDIGYTPITLDKNDADTLKAENIEVEGLNGFDKVSVYIWRSFTDILPLSGSATE